MLSIEVPRQDLIFQSAFENAAVGMAHMSLQGRWLRVNRKLGEITGYSRQELLAISFQGVTHPDDAARDTELLQSLLSNRISSYEVEKRYIRKDRSIIWVAIQVSVVFTPEGLADYGISVIQDISARKQAELETAVSHQRYMALFEQMPEGILLVDRSLRIIGHNPEAARLLHWSGEELLTLRIHDIEAIADAAAIEARRLEIEAMGRSDFESVYNTGDGTLLQVEASIKFVTLLNGQSLYQVLFRDISERKQAAQLIESLAYTDQLTGLANRSLLGDRLHQGMTQARRRGNMLAVVFLDLDGFKAVNDTYGHATGDLLLRSLAARMKECLREGDTLARLGGDEFVAVFLDLVEANASAPLLARLLNVASQVLPVGALNLQVSASLGVTFYPQAEEVDADQLLRQADQAMYQAKLSGKNRFHIFDAESDRTLRGQHASLERIRSALHNEEFVLFYQPKVNMRTRTVLGVEALIRWAHPQEGLLAPGHFLPVTENHRLSVDIGEWVIRQALLQLTEWQSRGIGLSISVNISAMQLQQADFLKRLQHLMAEFPQLKPHSLELEILETSALEDIAQAARVIAQCKALDVDFALDDFGTGYSSLTYLKRLPIPTVKIDQSFVRDMVLDQDNVHILDGILWIMRQLRRSVVAEGVETLEHARALMDLGCEMAQGYGIARPMPVAALAAWQQRWEQDADWQAIALVPRTAI
jgi:diguanylate cyclase (GGDEF)-like protein/PAS domain S-box-containing protein